MSGVDDDDGEAEDEAADGVTVAGRTARNFCTSRFSYCSSQQQQAEGRQPAAVSDR
jgi:hypothetical protein